VADGSVVNPGQHAKITVALQRPAAIDIGVGFAIREGGRTVGAGTVTALDTLSGASMS